MHLRRQQTIRRPATIEGRGLFLGKPVRLTLMPAAAHSGILLVRTDIASKTQIPATSQHLQPAQRRTAVGLDASRVDMVEHLLAALSAMQIDNCQIHLDGPEPPCGDGSALHFVEAIDRAGVLTQDEFRPCIVVTQPWRVTGTDDNSWIDLSPPSHDEPAEWSYDLDYPGTAIPSQSARCRITPATFTRELENMRTFVFEREIEQLRALGIGLHATSQDLLVLQEDGTPVDTVLRAPDECARHKLLDMIGDFALLGCDLLATINGHRSGHELNHQAVRSILHGLGDGRCRRLQPRSHRSAA